MHNKSHNTGGAETPTFDESHQYRTIMHLTGRARPQADEVNWTDLIDHPPSYEEIEQEISRWAAGITRSFARMPQRSDPGYDNRMLEAYISTCDTIAEDPEDIDAGMRIAYMWVQVTPYAGLIRVDGDELNLNRGPKHILAGWPAIVAGRYRQLCDLEQGEYHLHELADINTWISGGKYEPSYAEVEADWGDTYAGEQQILSNPVDPGLFNAGTWRALQEARPSLAGEITGHPSGKLSTNFCTLERQLEAYKRERSLCRAPLILNLLFNRHKTVASFTSKVVVRSLYFS